MMDGTHLRGIVSKAISSGEYHDGSDVATLVADVMDEDEAEEARKYFGVFKWMQVLDWRISRMSLEAKARREGLDQQLGNMRTLTKCNRTGTLDVPHFYSHSNTYNLKQTTYAKEKNNNESITKR